MARLRQNRDRVRTAIGILMVLADRRQSFGDPAFRGRATLHLGDDSYRLLPKSVLEGQGRVGSVSGCPFYAGRVAAKLGDPAASFADDPAKGAGRGAPSAGSLHFGPSSDKFGTSSGTKREPEH